LAVEFPPSSRVRLKKGDALKIKGERVAKIFPTGGRETAPMAFQSKESRATLALGTRDTIPSYPFHSIA
jgi:hypothetical protein